MTDADAQPEVPDDAPPAILFRLSYRANESHRSGYRPGDDRERIVASMRGWWELDPDEVRSLNIKYAVAFHRGVTRAVVEIDSWKWQHVPGSDHNVLDADDVGFPYDDDRWRGRDDVRWCFNARMRKAQRTAEVPKYVEEAWIGQNGKRVPASMRDTIVAFWPASPVASPRSTRFLARRDLAGCSNLLSTMRRAMVGLAAIRSPGGQPSLRRLYETPGERQLPLPVFRLATGQPER